MDAPPLMFSVRRRYTFTMSTPPFVANAIKHLQSRHVGALVLHVPCEVSDSATGAIAKTVWALIAYDWKAGIKLRALAIADIDDLDGNPDLMRIVGELPRVFAELEQGIGMRFGNSLKRVREIDSSEMTFAPRTVLYVNRLRLIRSSGSQPLTPSVCSWIS